MSDSHKTFAVVSRLDAVPHTHPVILAAGNFDGVHLGHKAVLARAVNSVVATNAHAWVLTFDPHPLAVIRPGCTPHLLSSPTQRARIFADLGLHGCIVLPFDKHRADEEPERFVDELFACIPSLCEMVVGMDWTFGRQARGNPALLAGRAAQRGLRVTVVEPVVWDGAPISSTRIRAALKAGQPEVAAAMLGHPYAIEGHIVQGRQFGRTLGFPTINLKNPLPPLAAPGIYAARVSVHVGDITTPRSFCKHAAAFIPEETSSTPVDIVEAHLFDYSGGDLYGRAAEVSLLKHLRHPQRFADVHALRQQIATDVMHARAFLTPS